MSTGVARAQHFFPPPAVYPTETRISEISPSPVVAGEPMRVSVTVRCLQSPYWVCTGRPGGPVTVRDGSDPSTTCTTGESDPRSCTIVYHSAGSHTVVAVYPGWGSFGESLYISGVTVGPRVFTLADTVTGSFFDSYLLFANPEATPEPVAVTVLKDDGTATDVPAVLPPYGRVTWKVDDIPGLGDGASSVRVTIPSGHPVFAERATYFARDYRAGQAVRGRFPARQAHFAEGCQNELFDTYLLIGNQANESAPVRVTFLLEQGEQVIREYEAPPGGRLVIAAAGIPELAGHSFGISVSSPESVAVERSMYFGPGYVGGHSEAGVPLPATQWLFAEGGTGTFFETFLLLSNPGLDVASVALVRYHTSEGATVTKLHTVPARGRLTIDVRREDPALAETTFWMDLVADVPLVAERAMYWASDGGPLWTEGHVSAGVTSPAPRWGFAEGIVGGGLDSRTYLLVANPEERAVTIDVQFLPAAGGSAIAQTYVVPAGGRLTIDVASDVPALRDVPFGATVTARDGGSIVAERSIYWMRGGPTFIGGTNAVGLPY